MYFIGVRVNSKLILERENDSDLLSYAYNFEISSAINIYIHNLNVNYLKSIFRWKNLSFR